MRTRFIATTSKEEGLKINIWDHTGFVKTRGVRFWGQGFDSAMLNHGHDNMGTCYDLDGEGCCIKIEARLSIAELPSWTLIVLTHLY